MISGRLQIVLPADEMARLRRMARERREPVSAFIRGWIRRTLLRQEDDARRAEAVGRIGRLDLPPPNDLAAWEVEYGRMKGRG
jgi:hypothetical protein